MKKIYLIGNSEEYNDYLENIEDINKLPIKNLPVVYFPFNYDSKNDTLDNINFFIKVVDNKKNIIEKISPDTEYSCDNNNDNKVKCSNLTNLFNLIRNMEAEWQPYNNNNMKVIMYILLIVWGIILLLLLKFIQQLLGAFYSKFILIVIGILLLIAILYSLIITGKYF